MQKKTTFAIDQAILEEAKAIVETRGFKSLNSFVEKAIKDVVERVQREEIKKAILEAGRDPLFLSDLKEIEYDFEFADSECQGR